jgi:membrane protein DedA with SNARE-associated domain
MADAGPAASRWLPSAEHLQGLSVPAKVVAIVVGTLISEDITCIAVGTLIRKGEVSVAVGGGACFLGIYIGDLLFFFLGRLGGVGLTKTRFFSRGFGPERLKSFGDWFDRRPWAAIAMCRVLPGIRVPLYLAVGALTKRTAAFFWWTCFFAFVWTPALIGLVVLLGDTFTAPFERFTGGGWKSVVLEVLTIYLIMRFIMLMATGEGRAKLTNRFGFLWGRRRVARNVRPSASGSGEQQGRGTEDGGPSVQRLSEE